MILTGLLIIIAIFGTMLFINLFVKGYSVAILKGISMQPTITYGGVGIVDNSVNNPQEFTEGDIILFKDQFGNNVAHRVVTKRDDGLLIEGDNTEYSLTHFIPNDKYNYKIYGRLEYRLAY